MNVINFIVQRNPSEEDSQYFYSDSEINYFKVDHYLTDYEQLWAALRWNISSPYKLYIYNLQNVHSWYWALLTFQTLVKYIQFSTTFHIIEKLKELSLMRFKHFKR